MRITKISIKRFRGFNNVDFELGSHLTAISGQNGTQKTTILGMLSQSFSITDADNPMREEKPLCGGDFISSFSDKFKLSEKFDIAGEHEWTLFFNDEQTSSYVIESIHRDKKEGTIRFWKKGDRSKGSGYIQLPVIYLSLKRLLPIAEDNSLKENKELLLTDEEFTFYQEWHNKILVLTRDNDKILSSSFLSSRNKQTLGANTNHYDWKVNSAGQDNLSKILLAILSFKRLKEEYNNEYKGGILAIDEIDATLYPASQIKLIDALIKFSAKYQIQIIFTTHSLSILKEVSRLQEEKTREDQIKIMFLIKSDGQVNIRKNINYSFISNHLNITLTGKPKSKKINVFTEDKEATIFSKSLLGNKSQNLNFIKVRLGCSNLIQLASAKVPDFVFPNSFIILDGDVKDNPKLHSRAKRLKNVLLLPTNKSPEQIISKFLNDLPDEHSLWESIDASFNHQQCFKDYSNEEIQTSRYKAKNWFNSHIEKWGRNASKVLNYWKTENSVQVEEFNDNFVKLYSEFSKKLGL